MVVCVVVLVFVGCGDDDAGGDAGFDSGAPPARDSGPPPVLDWSCLGSVVWPTPTDATLDVSFTITQSLTVLPLDGMLLRACERADVDCSAPTFEETSGPDGVVSGTLPLGATGWDGFLDVSGPGFVPMLIFTGKPVVAAGDEPRASVVSEGTFEVLASAGGVSADAARGHLGFNVRDCAGAPAWGVRADVSSADATSTLLYFVGGGIPSTDVTETDTTGNAGTLNLPPGPASVTVTRVETMERVGSIDVHVRAGHLTAFILAPTP